MSASNIVWLSFLVLAGGCAAISGSHDHYYTCAYDTVWDAAIDTLKGHSITSQNKEKGVIETAWIEMEDCERFRKSTLEVYTPWLRSCARSC